MREYRKLCLLDDLDGTGAWGGTLDGQSVFVIRTPKGLRAWLNQCPHQGVELNWQPHRFWDPEHQYVQCTMHGALFLPDTGECIFGPCQGDRLQSVPVRLQGNHILIQLPTTGT